MLLQFKNYNLSIQGNLILNDINIEIPKASRVGISGPSGAGKSLLVWSLVGGLPKEAQTSGTISFDNGGVTVDLLESKSNSSSGLIGHRISIIPQNPFTSLNPSRKCGDQIGETIRESKSTKEDRQNQILTTLKQLEFVDPKQIYNAYPHQLSGGELQRVVIAMAVINKPALLIADEPTTALDTVTTNEVLHAMTTWTSENDATLIIVSHDKHVLSKMCDSVVFLENGSIVEDNDSHKPYSINSTGSASIQNEQLVKIKDLNKSFKIKGDKDEVVAVNNVSLDLNSGEILGIVGASGSGKSTIAKLLAGLEEPDSGEMRFNDKPINYNLHPELRKEIQMIFQDPYSALYPHMSVGYCIEEPLKLHHGLKGQELKDAALKLMSDVELNPAYYDQHPTRLSGGERQRVQIARALSVDPSVLICDECITGLDLDVQNKILQILLNLKAQHQLSIMFISHDLLAVQSIADKIAVMSNGEIVEMSDTKAIMTHPKHEITRKLLAGPQFFDESVLKIY